MSCPVCGHVPLRVRVGRRMRPLAPAMLVLAGGLLGWGLHGAWHHARTLGGF